MPRPALRRAGLAAAAFLLAASAAARAADDDFEFADALSRRGYTDLATERYESLIRDPKSTTQQKAAGQYGLALLTYADARFLAAERNDKRRKPMEEVLARFDEADKSFARFIEENASHPRNLEAKLSRGKLLQDKAEYVNVCIENSWLPAGSSESNWKKQVADWFDTAIGLFQTAEKNAMTAKDAVAPADRSGPAWEDLVDRWGLVWLFRLAALYGKGSALGKGDPAGTAALTQCMKEGSDDYQWEFGETVRGLWAIHFAGLAAAALDNPGNAYGYLKTAGSLRDPSPPILDVTFQSYRELGKACLAFGRRDKDDWPKKALKDFEDLAASTPDWKKHPEGQRAGVVWARLLEGAGQSERAITLVSELVKLAEQAGSPSRFELTRELQRLLTGGGGSGGGGGGGTIVVDPATARRIAMNCWREQDLAGTIAAFHAVIRNSKSKEDVDQYVWEAWDYIGRCYGVSGRYYEAFLAFDQIEQAWRKDKTNETLSKLTDETGYSRAAALDAWFAKVTKDPADKALAKEALDEFARDHPDSPRNQGTEERRAFEALREAEQFAGSDPAAHRAGLEQALKAFQGLGATSKSIEHFRAVVAQIHQKMGNSDRAAPDVAALDEAIRLADAWLAEKRADATESTVRRAREQGRRIALLVALSARADKAAALVQKKDRDGALKANQDLLAAIDRLGADFREVAANGQIQIDRWRAEGLIGVGRVDDADQLVAKLLESDPTSRNNMFLAALMGKALEDLALQRKGIGDLNAYKQLMLRAAKRREWWLENQKEADGSPSARNPNIVRTIAANYAEGGDFAKAEALFLESQKSFDDQAAVAKSADERKWGEDQSRQCRIELIDLLVKQEKYDAAIPQLEKELAKDPKDREAFLKRVQASDYIPDAQISDVLSKTDANKVLLDKLSQAYMRAPSKERLLAAVNFCYILNFTMKQEERHEKEYVEYLFRRAEAYLMLGDYTKQPDFYRAGREVVANKVVIPNLVEAYETTLPGSKRRCEGILQKAGDGLRKLGTK